MRFGVQVDLNSVGLDLFRREFTAGLSARSASTHRRVFKKWQLAYREFLRRRYARQSRGAGAWPPHASPQGHLILRDTETIYRRLADSFSVTHDTTGAVGIKVMMPRERHPEAPMLLERLVGIHHFGLGVVPVREIWVKPSRQAKEKMRGHMQDWLRSQIAKANSRIS